MFDRLTDSFHGLFRRLSGNATLSESNIREAMTEVRASLLEADVNLAVVDSFCDSVVKDALGADVLKSLQPGEQIIGIVYRRLVDLLGGPSPTAVNPDGSPAPLAPVDLIMRASPAPTIIMMCGLQGSGKTTTCGKLAAYLKKRGRSVMLAAADLQRPAAVEQLETVSKQVQGEMAGGSQVLFYSEPDKVAEYGKAVGVAIAVCQRAVAAAKKAGVDVLILDTAGRLHVNDALMGELSQINKSLHPHHIFLVVDAMTGQDAVNSAKAFHAQLEVDGIILTKFDSDTRGGAALSVKQVTGAPIRFIGVGERLEALEEFHSERIAGRMLGMGDVVSLVEKAQQEVTEEEAEALNEKLAKGQMTMDDFLKQMKTLRRMGPMKQLLGLLPGVGSLLKNVDIDEKHLDRVEAMIGSMTVEEKKRPEVIDNSRRRRIAHGSGTKQEDIGNVVKQFINVSKMTQQMANMSPTQKMKAVKEMQTGGMALPGMRSKGSSYSASPKDRFKKRKK